MPYRGPDDPKLPSNVKGLDAAARKQWVAIFNRAYADCQRKGGNDCETNAFKLANGVAKKGAEHVTKHEADGKDYPASDYAYVPDPAKPSTWKLRLTESPGGAPDAGIVGAAAAALGPGYQGQKVEIPAASRASVKEKVRAAWKRANPGKSDDAMPVGIKAHERLSDVLRVAHELAEGDTPAAQIEAWVAAELQSIQENGAHAAFDGSHTHTHQHGDLTHSHSHEHDGDAQHAGHDHEPHMLPSSSPSSTAAEPGPCACDDCDDASDCADCATCDGTPMQAGEPSSSDVHLDGAGGAGKPAGKRARVPGVVYLNKLREHLQGKVTPEDFASAVAKARGHAGGKAKGKGVADPANSELATSYQELGFSYLPYSGPTPGDWDSALESDDDDDEPWEIGPQLEKQDPRVAYGPSTEVSKACGLCRFYDGDDMSCRLIEGVIRPDYWCQLFSPEIISTSEPPRAKRANVLDLCATHAGAADPWRLFVEVAKPFAEPPEWLPLLPRPGVFAHPQYGEIVITRQRNERFLRNLQSNVYGQRIPVDLEHEGKLSGAVGYFGHEARMNDDGSIDVRMQEWTPRGQQAIREDRFPYVSPEWYDEWTEPLSKATHRDVVIGAALTTHPFFKERDLRSLVASERGIYLSEPAARHSQPQGGTMDPKQQTQQPPTPGGTPPPTQSTPPPAAQQAGEVTPQAFAEVQQQLKEAREQLAEQRASARTKRFTDLVTGRGGESDGQRWAGDPAHNVQILTVLADQFGEDSEIFQKHVTEESAKAAQAGTIYGEIGLGGGAPPPEADGKLQVEADKLAEQHPEWSKQKAMAEATKRNPQLYAEHDRARKRRAQQA